MSHHHWTHIWHCLYQYQLTSSMRSKTGYIRRYMVYKNSFCHKSVLYQSSVVNSKGRVDCWLNEVLKSHLFFMGLVFIGPCPICLTVQSGLYKKQLCWPELHSIYIVDINLQILALIDMVGYAGVSFPSKESLPIHRPQVMLILIKVDA